MVVDSRRIAFKAGTVKINARVAGWDSPITLQEWYISEIERQIKTLESDTTIPNRRNRLLNAQADLALECAVLVYLRAK